MFENLTPIVGIAGLALVVLILGIAVAKRYKVAKSNEAFIITGRKSKSTDGQVGEKVVTAGGVFVLPFIQQLAVMDLSSRRINVRVDGAPSAQGIALNVSGVASVKVKEDDVSIRAAAQRFGSQQAEIDNFTTDQLSGALRAIVGNLSVEELIRDREKFAQQVLSSVTENLAAQGLHMDSFTIQEVSDHNQGTYIADMGRASAAEIRRNAEIAEANTHRESSEARIEAETQVANYQRSLALRQAEIQAETDRATAQAASAGPLEAAAREQEILAQRELVAERRATLTEKELDTTVRRPADAARYQMEQEAEGRRVAAVKAAEAAKAEAALRGEGDLALRTAQATATKLEGEAEAAATAAKGTAEAEALHARAEAYKQFTEAAVLDRLLETLPQVARELAAPMGNIDKLTVISTDGASALPKAVANNFSQLQEIVQSTTGLDMSAMLSSFAGGKLAATAPVIETN